MNLRYPLVLQMFFSFDWMGVGPWKQGSSQPRKLGASRRAEAGQSVYDLREAGELFFGGSLVRLSEVFYTFNGFNGFCLCILCGETMKQTTNTNDIKEDTASWWASKVCLV